MVCCKHCAGAVAAGAVAAGAVAAGAVAVIVPQNSDNHCILLAKCHYDPLAGHLGVYSMVAILAKKFWWHGMLIDCKEYFCNCMVR